MLKTKAANVQIPQYLKIIRSYESKNTLPNNFNPNFDYKNYKSKIIITSMSQGLEWESDPNKEVSLNPERKNDWKLCQLTTSITEDRLYSDLKERNLIPHSGELYSFIEQNENLIREGRKISTIYSLNAQNEARHYQAFIWLTPPAMALNERGSKPTHEKEELFVEIFSKLIRSQKELKDTYAEGGRILVHISE